MPKFKPTPGVNCNEEPELEYEVEVDFVNHRPTKTERLIAKMDTKQKMVYDLLDLMVNDLGEAGVDVSYFPEAAQLVMIEYADKIIDKFEEYLFEQEI